MPRRLLLLGAGPAHLQLLAAFARKPLPDTELALLSPEPFAVHAPRVPAFIVGRVAGEACRVDVAALAAAAGATWLRERVLAFDATSRTATRADGSCVAADWVSIDEPGGSDRDALPGAREHALALHPAERFVALFDALVELAARRPLDVLVIGGDAPAVEAALAIARRLGPRADQRARIALVAGAAGPLPDWPEAARNAALRALRRTRVTVFREACAGLRADAAVLAQGARLACDAAVLATPAVPPAWIAASGLALGDDGWPQRTSTLQSPTHPQVLVPGPAAGSRAGALAAALRRALAGEPLPAVAALPTPARWLRCDGGRALLAWRGTVVAGHAVGVWCRWRDQRAWQRLADAGRGPTRSAGS